MLALYYIRWDGTPEELNEYLERIKNIGDEIEGTNFKGIFLPTSGWNFVLLIETKSFDKILEVYKLYMKKYGPHPKISVGKLETLLTPEEVGLTT